MPPGGGRPKLRTEEIGRRILELKAKGLTWADVGRQVGLAPETCRKAYRDLRRGAQNPPQATPEEFPPGETGGGSRENPGAYLAEFEDDLCGGG